MSLPELLANTSTAIGTLTHELALGATTMEVSTLPPAPLQASGQFRVIVGTEIILVTGGATTTTWKVLRKQEETAEAAHTSGAEIEHELTALGVFEAFAGPAGGDLTGTFPSPSIGPLKVIESKLAGEAVSAAKIAAGAVTEAKLATGAVTEGKLAAEAVHAAQIAAEAVLAGKIATGAVTELKIASEAVAAAKIATNAVIAAKIAAEAVETSKIKNEAVTKAKIGPEAVDESKIKGGAVTESKLAGEAVTAAKLASEAVETAKIKAAAITAEKLGAEAVAAAKIATEAVENAKIKAEAVTGGTTTSSKIAKATIHLYNLNSEVEEAFQPREKFKDLGTSSATAKTTIELNMSEATKFKVKFGGTEPILNITHASTAGEQIVIVTEPNGNPLKEIKVEGGARIPQWVGKEAPFGSSGVQVIVLDVLGTTGPVLIWGTPEIPGIPTEEEIVKLIERERPEEALTVPEATGALELDLSKSNYFKVKLKENQKFKLINRPAHVVKGTIRVKPEGHEIEGEEWIEGATWFPSKPSTAKQKKETEFFQFISVGTAGEIAAYGATSSSLTEAEVRTIAKEVAWPTISHSGEAFVDLVSGSGSNTGQSFTTGMANPNQAWEKLPLDSNGKTRAGEIKMGIGALKVKSVERPASFTNQGSGLIECSTIKTSDEGSFLFALPQNGPFEGDEIFGVIENTSFKVARETGTNKGVLKEGLISKPGFIVHPGAPVYGKGTCYGTPKKEYENHPTLVEDSGNGVAVMCISGLSEAPTSGGYVQDIRLGNFDIKGTQRIGVFASYQGRLRIDKMQITESKEWGIRLGEATMADIATIRDVETRENGEAAKKAKEECGGINTGGGAGRSAMYDCRTFNDFGIGFAISNGVTMYNCGINHVEKTSITETGQTGYGVRVQPGSKNVSMVGCYFEKNEKADIYVDKGALLWMVACRFNGSTGPAEYAISCGKEVELAWWGGETAHHSKGTILLAEDTVPIEWRAVSTESGHEDPVFIKRVTTEHNIPSFTVQSSGSINMNHTGGSKTAVAKVKIKSGTAKQNALGYDARFILPLKFTSTTGKAVIKVGTTSTGEEYATVEPGVASPNYPYEVVVPNASYIIVTLTEATFVTEVGGEGEVPAVAIGA